jgi:CheY-like chemotaxis protein
VLAASSGKDALELVSSGAAVDLLLTDMVLPGGIGGRELAERSRQRMPNLAVLFISGYAADGSNQDGRLDSGIRLLPKPFHRADLARAVREALDEMARPMALRA